MYLTFLKGDVNFVLSKRKGDDFPGKLDPSPPFPCTLNLPDKFCS